MLDVIRRHDRSRVPPSSDEHQALVLELPALVVLGYQQHRQHRACAEAVLAQLVLSDRLQVLEIVPVSRHDQILGYHGGLFPRVRHRRRQRVGVQVMQQGLERVAASGCMSQMRMWPPPVAFSLAGPKKSAMKTDDRAASTILCAANTLPHTSKSTSAPLLGLEEAAEICGQAGHGDGGAQRPHGRWRRSA